MTNKFLAIPFRFAIICLLFFLNQACSNNPLVPTDTAVIEGIVVGTDNLRPIEGVLVRSSSFAETAVTDIEGKYSLSVQLPDSNSFSIFLAFSKSGFTDLSLNSIVIQNGKLTSVPDAVLTETGEVTGESGPAANVVLVEVETNSIFVKTSGANETSKLTFEVRDNEGIPVDLANQVKVCFRIEGGPNGGEFLAPDSTLTNLNGQVTTTINSGTIAGALQVVAEVAGTVITSSPVPISIHGWLPDINHFSVVCQKLNFAGYNLFGLENAITAFVGDKFSNPVPPGTSIQFQSTGGIISGSDVTDELGRATVILTSAAPQPQGVTGASFPFNQPGFALITAQTVDENQNSISKTHIVLFSGITQITNVNPNTFSLNAGQSQQFTFTVSDQNLNPLVAGTNITVTSSEGELAGDTGVTLDDTQSRGATQFTFILTNSDPDLLPASAVNVTVGINVASQNGNARFTITGQMFQ